MPEFVIEREIPGASGFSEAQIREASLKSLEVLRELGSEGSEIRWIHSFVTDDKIYCIYYAADENLVREHARRAGFPANRVEAVRRLLNPSDFT